jgi:hypothetical protein
MDALGILTTDPRESRESRLQLRCGIGLQTSILRYGAEEQSQSCFGRVKAEARRTNQFRPETRSPNICLLFVMHVPVGWPGLKTSSQTMKRESGNRLKQQARLLLPERKEQNEKS